MLGNILTLGEYEFHRELCHQVKTSIQATKEAAKRMSQGIRFPSDGILIPVPSHTGHATYTTLLCKEISALTGLPFRDALSCNEHDSLYQLKKSNSPLPHPKSLNFHLKAEIPQKLTPILVDNVIASGTTMTAALLAIPNGIPCSIAVDIRILQNSLQNSPRSPL